MNIIGLISCYDEGYLLESTILSALAACDEVGIFEGPVGKQTIKPLRLSASLKTKHYLHTPPVRRYKDDADKRNVALSWAKKKWPRDDTWIVWLDGDEVLIWPEYLRDWVQRGRHVTGVGGIQLRIVELDGSVVFSNGRVVRTAVIKRYLLAASQVVLNTGMIIALPHELLCTAGGMPVKPADGWGMEPAQMDAYLARYRPPVAGEPHILHRSLLRDPKRGVQRQNVPESEWFPPQVAT